MLGFLGGTGPEGRGLAMRFAKSGEQVFIGSRTSERGIAAARSLQQKVPSNIRGGTNEEAAENSEVIFLATPYEGLKATIKPIEGHLREKIVITVVAPLSFQRAAPLHIRCLTSVLQAASVTPEPIGILEATCR